VQFLKKLTQHFAAAPPPPVDGRPSPPVHALIVVCLRHATWQIHVKGPLDWDIAIWFHCNILAKFPSLILFAKRESPFPKK
jgi:hypothetical protein